jgi:predicted amidohydrolase YtcJ
MKIKHLPGFIATTTLLAATPLLALEYADTIYTGGSVLTMSDATPRAEAVAVSDGRVLAVGTQADVVRHQGKSTDMVDLAGRTLIPGFVDAHGHVFLVGIQARSANLLPAPDGEVNDIATLQRVLQQWNGDKSGVFQSAGLIIGFGYDDSQLAGLRHPTRDELDKISTQIPVYIIHQSGHIGVGNSKALEVAGISASTEEFPGGVIRRRPDSAEPDGVLEETPHFVAISKLLAGLDRQDEQKLFEAGVTLYTSFGYTTAQEGRSMPRQVTVMEAVAAEGSLPIDVVAYPDVLVDRDMIGARFSPRYKNRFRVGGAKLTIDGSPQGFTAWRDRPYYKPPPQYRADYAGYPATTADQVFDTVDWAFSQNIQLLTHANGEAATDVLIAAVQTAEAKYGRADRRPVLIHGQFLREDQVDALNRLNIFPSLFPMHTFYWGDWHRERTVGPTAAGHISPTGWMAQRGMRFSTHHDAPVALPDSMRVLDATVTRRSRSGDIVGASQRVDVMTALKAMTLWPAWQHFEDTNKGSIEAGKLADLVILSADPTAVDPETLDTIHVVETIKEGQTIYRRAVD